MIPDVKRWQEPGFYPIPTKAISFVGYSDWVNGRHQSGTYELDPHTGRQVRKPKQLPIGTRYERDDEGWIKIHTTPDMWTTKEFIEDHYPLGLVRYPGNSFRPFTNVQTRTWTIPQILGVYA